MVQRAATNYIGALAIRETFGGRFPGDSDEYRAVVRRLGQKRNVDVTKLSERLLMLVDYVTPTPLPHQVCDDPDDDKFITAAIAGKAEYVVTGDKALLRVRLFHRTKIITPNTFLAL